MSLMRHHNFHIHSFLANKEMNEIYASYGISNFAIGLISIFVPIYFFGGPAGCSPPAFYRWR
ncbi:MAG: hypothetical protein Q8O93_05890 [bacterium]|nr:hypothetical protein [bacterium]